MRILHISKYAPPIHGGIETFVRDLSEEQACQGHDVTVLCHHASPLRISTSEKIEGVRITRCGVLCKTGFAPIAPLFARNLATEITACRPQVIHIHLPNPCVLFNRFLPQDIPLVIHWHADVQGAPNRVIDFLYPAYRRFETKTLEKACHIIATSPPYLESSTTLSRFKTKCSVVPLGLNEARYPEDNDAAPSSPPMIFSVGRFTYYKGFDQLVQAATMVPDAHFLIAGDGKERPGIQAEIERLGLADRFRLCGMISDAELCRLLQTASAVCLPSVDRGEAFGVTLLEAMRYGLPVISTAIPGSGTGWVNQDSITGRVVPPASPEALAEAIQSIIHAPAQAADYGQAARQRFMERFTISEVATQIDEIYRRNASPRLRQSASS